MQFNENHKIMLVFWLQMSCRMLGGFLVEIETEAEFEAIRALARVQTPGTYLAGRNQTAEPKP